ncbi:unnamed protein product [Ranitomeya imitator]|uniref:Uncharacterized protein n=1 Tax=Ranitomeya imitator TaxID=111125 RepID=A0ABN9L084_9NEOB|nr:unnamed protein product [Ranitomeya imitator]
MKKRRKRDDVPASAASYHPAGVDYPGLLVHLHVVALAPAPSKRLETSTFSALKSSRSTITPGPSP